VLGYRAFARRLPLAPWVASRVFRARLFPRARPLAVGLWHTYTCVTGRSPRPAPQLMKLSAVAELCMHRSHPNKSAMRCEFDTGSSGERWIRHGELRRTLDQYKADQSGPKRISRQAQSEFRSLYSAPVDEKGRRTERERRLYP
jgi:hypothetical protein